MLPQMQDENLMTPLPKGFKIGSHGSNAQMMGSEYVPEGETVQDWSRMITVQVFRNLKGADPDKFAKGTGDRWQSACPGADVGKVRDGRERGYGFSLWMFRCPLNPKTQKPENTYIKLISGKDALYVVQYAYRAPLTRENIPPAMAYLGSVWVCDSRLPDRPCPQVTAKAP